MIWVGKGVREREGEVRIEMKGKRREERDATNLERVEGGLVLDAFLGSREER